MSDDAFLIEFARLIVQHKLLLSGVVKALGYDAAEKVHYLTITRPWVDRSTQWRQRIR